MIVGFTNGCFDLLHEGHLHLLRQCREMCDMLIVGINSDRSVRALKGAGRPVESLGLRMESLQATRLVSMIIPFDSEEALEILIGAVRPDRLFKGGEYTGQTIVGSRYVARIVLIPMLPGHSTTALVERMRR